MNSNRHNRRTERARQYFSGKRNHAAPYLRFLEKLEPRTLLSAILSGQTIAGTIATLGQQDSYTFTVSAGNTFKLSVGDADANSLFHSELTVLGPNAAQVATASTGFTHDSASVTFTAPATGAGTYTVIVQSLGGTTLGAYDLDLVVVPATQAPDADGDGGVITSGQGKSGAINHYGDLDVYTFTASAGNSFELSVGDSSASSDFRPEITVFAPNGAQVGAAATGFADTSSAVNYTVPAGSSGTYTVIVQSDGGSNLGTYNLDLALAPSVQSPDPDGDGGVITSGQGKSGTINHFGDLDVYTFSATAGQSVRLSAGDANASSDFRPEITVFGPSGAQVGTAGTGFTHTSAEVNFTASGSEAGTYTVIVQSDGGSNLGAYNLDLAIASTTQSADPDGDGGTIFSGQGRVGTINHYGDLDVYTFSATAGNAFELTVGDTDVNSDFRPQITVYGPSGSQVGAAATGFSHASSAVTYNVPATGSGMYTVVVQSSGGSNLGTYELDLALAPGTQTTDLNGDGGVITSGQGKTGAINHFGDLDVYTFTAASGQSVRLSAGDANASSDFRPEVTVFGPTGAQVGTAGTGFTHTSAEVNFTASGSEAGTYTVIVQSDGGSNLGAYNLDLAIAATTQSADPDGDGGTISSGQSKVGTINHYGDLDVYTFSASGGNSYILSAGDTDANSDFRPQITVYGPTGSQVGAVATGFSHTSSEVTYNVPATASGMYTVVVQSTGGSNLGTYDLDLALAPTVQSPDPDGDGGTLSSGQTRGGAINHYGDLDVYTFSATAGNTFSLLVGDANAASDFRPQLTVYGPTGAQVGAAATGFSNTSVTSTFAVPAGGNGTYTVVVQSNGGSNLGAYDLEMIQASTSGPITPGVLTPNTPVLGRINTAGEHDSWTIFGQAGQDLSVLLNPGTSAAANFMAPFAPALGWANLSLIAPDGTTVLATANTSTFGQVLTFNGITLPSNGNYTIAVTAAPAHAASTGDYILGAYAVTPNLLPLQLNQNIVGNIAVPFDFDQYSFTAPANTQVQFKLAAGSSNAVSYTLTGPNDTPIFTNITASSDPIDLPADGVYTLTASGTGGQIGKYGFTLANTTQISLALGTPFTGVSFGGGQAEIFAIPITGTDPISLTLTDPNAADHNEIFASFGHPPTLQDFDFGLSTSGANQTLLIPSGKPTTLYVLVYNESVQSSPGSFTLLAQSSPVVLTGATPNQGAANSPTVMTLTGAGFNSATAVSLIGSDNTVYPATSFTVDLPAQITATFAAGSVPAGTYAVRVSSGESSSQLPNALTLAASGVGILTTHLETPSVIGNHIASTLYVDYSNTGTAAIPAPLLIVDATRPSNTGSGVVHGAFMTLDPTLITSGFWTSAVPQGYSTSVEILASGKTPGVLEPGESVRIPVYYAGWLQSQWNFANPAINFSLSVIQAGDTAPEDWTTTLQGLQPSTINNTAWSAISANLLTKLGNTDGSYVQMLDNSAAYLQRLGENDTDAESLWNFNVQQADAAVSTVGPTLVSVTDDSVLAPGNPIDFTRSFSSTISGRDTLGLLGYGWSTPWQMHASIGSDGTVTILGSGDFQEVFQPDSRSAGTYFSSTGDHNVLSADGSGGFLLKTTDGDVSDFSATGNLMYVQDSSGNRISATYIAGRLAKLTQSSGQSLSIAYNAGGLIGSITDSAGRTTTYTYNGAQQLVSVQDFSGLITSYTYAGTTGPTANALTSITSPGGVHTFFTYNAQGQLTGTHGDNNADATTYSYNQGAVTSTDALNDSSTEYFNSNGQVAKTMDALGNANYYTYDSSFNLIATTGPTGLTQNYTYNAAGELTSSTDQLGNTTLYTLGTDGRVTSVVDANGNPTQYAYNPAGDLLGSTYADGSSSSGTFNPLGLPISFVDQDGQATSYTYNAAGQVTQESFSDNTSYAYTYDAHGNLLTATDATGTTTFTYDSHDFMISVNYPGGRSLTFTYNADGQRTSMVDQTGYVTNYQYDAAGRLIGLTDANNNPITSYTYDAAGRLSTTTNGDGTLTTYTYDADGNILHLINYAADHVTIDSEYDYTYDSLGNMLTSATPDGTWTYSYNAANRLTHAVFVSTNLNISNQDIAYTYDAVGNRTSVTTNGVMTPYVVNNVNQYTSIGGVNQTYDADGNLLSDGSTTYTYDPLGEVTSATGPGGTSSYQYNSLNQLVSDTNNGVQTSNLSDPLDPGDTLATYDSNGDTVANYNYGNGLASFVAPEGQQTYLSYDALGSTVGETSSQTIIYDGPGTYTPTGYPLGPAVQPGTPGFAGQTGAMPQNDGTYQSGGVSYSPSTGEVLNSPGGLGDELLSAGNQLIGIGGLVSSAYHTITDSDIAGTISEGLDKIGVIPALYEYRNDAIEFFEHPDAINFEKVKTGFEGLVVTGGSWVLKGGAQLAELGGLISEGAAAFLSDIVPLGPLAYITGIGIGEFLELHGIDLRNIALNAENALKAKFNSVYDALKKDLSDLAKTLGDALLSAISSHDPNSLIGPNSFGSAGYIADAGTYTYTVNFENSPTATAPAQEVTITDQLDPNLDWSTFQLSQIGFGDTTILIPQGSQSYQTVVPLTYDGQTFDVQVEAGIHTDTGQVYANFYSIDPTTGLPPSILAGFLPPEDGTGRGEGYVTYSVAPKPNLITGTQITNVASIIFDNSTAITTDQVDDSDASKGTDPTKRAPLTIDSVAPTSSVTALPGTETSSNFTVNWSGQDDVGGSGVGTFDIFVSDNGGDFVPWLTNTANTSATFNGVNGHIYSFYSIAQDNVGNVEVKSPLAEASTTISSTPTELGFTQQPSVAYVGKPLSLPLAVGDEDANGGLINAGSANITVSVLTGPHGGALTGTATIAAVDGGATFDGLSFTKAGTYTLKASDGNLANATSMTINVVLPPTHLVFKKQPSAVIAGHDIGPAVTVEVLDASNHIVTSDNSTVALTLGPVIAGNTFSGTLSIPVINGIATFSDLSLTKSGSYTLTATDGALKSIKSAAFTVKADTASAQLALVHQPSSTLVGKPLAPSLSLNVVDRYGNPITSGSSKVVLNIVSGPTTGSLHGVTTVALTGGHATFSAATLSAVGTYTLAATDLLLPVTIPVTFSQTISQGNATAAAPVHAASYTSGQTINLTTTFKSSAPASIPFTGTASVVDQNMHTLGTATINANGTVHFSLTGVATGSYTCTINYSGDDNHTAGDSKSFSFIVK